MRRSLQLTLVALLGLIVGGCDEEDNLLFGVGTDGQPVAQPGVIEGTVTATGVPVGAAWVVALELRDSTLTDSQGRYRFVDVPASVHTLSLRVPLRYRLVPGDSTTQTVTVGAGGRGTASWRLMPAGPLH